MNDGKISLFTIDQYLKYFIHTTVNFWTLKLLLVNPSLIDLVVLGHQKNMPMKSTPSHTQLIAKTGFYMGLPIFLILDPKYTLWVLVRIASARRSKRAHTINVLSKIIENIDFSDEFSVLNAENSLCILHARVFVMKLTQCNNTSAQKQQ